MSTPQWQNLPQPPNSGGQGWARFSADPRDARYQQVRASDADRTNAASMLADAYAEGRLDKDEYDQRVNQAMNSKTLGELVPVLGDLAVDPGGFAQSAMPPSGQGSRGLSMSRFPRWWLGMAVMFNLIWLMTVVGTGHFIYYWPMWPMLGTAIPLLMGWFGGGSHRRQSAPEENRQLPPGRDKALR